VYKKRIKLRPNKIMPKNTETGTGKKCIEGNEEL
jgi:hypothetical protein